jgi:hypothetical protein
MICAQEVCVRASWVGTYRPDRCLWAHEHQLMCPEAARRVEQEDNENGEGFVDYLYGYIPAATYLVYYFFKNHVQNHAFHCSFEEAKQQCNEWIARIDFYGDEVRMTEETTEGHV